MSIELIGRIVTPDYISFMLRGARLSLTVAGFALIFGTILGIIGAAGRISKNKLIYGASTVYVELVRGTPMLLQIYFLFLGLPAIAVMVTGRPINLPLVTIGIIAMSINSGAYSAELFRAAIQGIDKGQWEAAKSLGLNYFDTMRFIILPQAVKRVIPPMVSEFVTLIKDSSLLGAIGMIELLNASRVIGSRYYNFVIPLLMASAVYLILTITISKLSAKLERRLAASD